MNWYKNMWKTVLADEAGVSITSLLSSSKSVSPCLFTILLLLLTTVNCLVANIIEYFI